MLCYCDLMKFITSSTHLQLLLDAGANPNGVTDHGKDGQVETPLQMAAASGNGHVLSFMSINRRLDSSVGSVPDCCAGGRGFEPQSGPGQGLKITEENVLPVLQTVRRLSLLR